jgi:hypothetical protein
MLNVAFGFLGRLSMLRDGGDGIDQSMTLERPGLQLLTSGGRGLLGLLRCARWR